MTKNRLQAFLLAWLDTSVAALAASHAPLCKSRSVHACEVADFDSLPEGGINISEMLACMASIQTEERWLRISPHMAEAMPIRSLYKI